MIKIELKKILIVIFGIYSFNANAETDIPMQPDFSLPDVEGVERSISEWDGQVKMVNFWATWCGPCVREIPLINEYHNKYSDKGFSVVGIAIDEPDEVKNYLTETTMDYTTLVELEKGQDVALEYSSEFLGLPFTAFVDHEGRILFTKMKEVHAEEIDLILERMWKVRDGSMSAEQARTEIAAAMAELEQTH